MRDSNIEITLESARTIDMSRVAREAGLYAAAREIWTRHPLLEVASDFLSGHLSAALPGRDQSLLKDCLVDAIAGYRRAEREHGEVVSAYVIAMLQRATDVFDLSIRATVADGVIAWQPLEESLEAFCARYLEARIVATQVEREERDQVPNESMLLLGARLMPEYIGRYVVRHVMAHGQHAAV